MNKDLQTILAELDGKLAKVKKTNISKPEISLKDEVIELQQELLNASILSMDKLEARIKEQLKYKEMELDSYNNANRELELGYLVQYIKERYD